jgi:branched-chain amino acid transport system permease protein
MSVSACARNSSGCRPFGTELRMNIILVAEQALNGLQFGIMLFLISAGLTLVFGIMNLINLAHGVLYMVGAYIGASVIQASGSFWQGIAAAISGTLVVGIVIELLTLRRLYGRSHLDQVLVTFGLTLSFNELVRILWGPTPLYAAVPPMLAGQIELLPGLAYPTYRLLIILVGLAAAFALYGLVGYTRIGMLIRAGASNRVMVEALGVNIKLLYTTVFGLGAALAALAGVMAGPILAVESGMGNEMLILALVVIVIGGVGSIRGAFIASILIGIVDTMGRTVLRPLLATLMAQSAADNAGPAIASMSIYLLMAIVLFFRPRGLFPPRIR